MDKICELCGEAFNPTQKTQKYCNKKHYKKCPICNVEFFLKKNKDKLTCSTKCASYYRSKNVRYDCMCKLCCKNFKGKIKNSNVCEDPHYGKCVICENQFVITDNHRPSKTCSSSCASSLSHTLEAKENRIKSSLERYGTEYPFQAKEVVEKIKKSLDNSKKDMRIGSERWKEMLDKKYDVENISQVEEIKLSKKKTYYQKYGVHNPAAIQINNYTEWLNFKEFIKNKNWDCIEIASFFNVNFNTIRKKAYETNSEIYIKDFYKYSSYELEVKHIIENYGFKESIDFIPHDRTLIKPLEIDFYFPKLNLALEISPTHTHNSKYGWHKKGSGVEKEYHYKKNKLCREKGVNLITIFEWMPTNYICTVLEDLLFNDFEINPEFIIDERNNSANITKNKTNLTLLNNLINSKKDKLKNDGINKICIISNLNEISSLNYIDLGFIKKKEIGPKLHYHNPKRNILIKSNKTINKHREILENYGFLPVYDCGYEVWELTI